MPWLTVFARERHGSQKARSLRWPLRVASAAQIISEVCAYHRSELARLVLDLVDQQGCLTEPQVPTSPLAV